MNKCWICSEKEANSREHVIKSSNLNMVFGNIVHESPIFTHRNGRDRKLNSKNNINAKFELSICQRCNDTLTQPHDLSWDKLSCFLLDNEALLRRKRRLNLSECFGDKVKTNLLNCRLFLAKILGCIICESNNDFFMSDLARSIRENEEISNLHFSINIVDSNKVNDYCELSHLEVIENGNIPIWVSFIYLLNGVAIKVVYCVDNGLVKSKMIGPHHDSLYTYIDKI